MKIYGEMRRQIRRKRKSPGINVMASTTEEEMVR
jgi:hypothetical protein